MSSLPRMDRMIVKRTTLYQQGLDAGVPDATPEERLMMVWPLTLTAWAFTEQNFVPNSNDMLSALSEANIDFSLADATLAGSQTLKYRYADGWSKTKEHQLENQKSVAAADQLG